MLFKRLILICIFIRMVGLFKQKQRNGIRGFIWTNINKYKSYKLVRYDITPYSFSVLLWRNITLKVLFVLFMCFNQCSKLATNGFQSPSVVLVCSFCFCTHISRMTCKKREIYDSLNRFGSGFEVWVGRQ